MTDHAVSSRARRSGVARLWRGWVVALLAVLFAAGSHQAAHSVTHGSIENIPWQLLVFSAALTAPIAVALAGRRVATWGTTATIVFGQVAFHLLYSLPYTGVSDLPNGHHQHQGAAPIAEAQLAHINHAAHSTGSTDAVMLLAHLIAVALTTWVIVHGERSLLIIVAWLLLTPINLLWASSPLSTDRVCEQFPTGRVWVPHPMNIAPTRWTRGPPVLA